MWLEVIWPALLFISAFDPSLPHNFLHRLTARPGAYRRARPSLITLLDKLLFWLCWSWGFSLYSHVDRWCPPSAGSTPCLTGSLFGVGVETEFSFLFLWGFCALKFYYRR